jgi:hypothetical protein
VLAFYRLPVRCGPELPHALASERRRRSLRDQLQSAWELDDVQRMIVHIAKTPVGARNSEPGRSFTGMAKPELAKVVASSGFMIPENVILTPAY